MTFWTSAGVLLLVLLSLLPALDNGAVGTPDDGVYAAQAARLAEGAWNQTRPAPDVDADGSNSAIGPELVYGDQEVPYHRHPLLPIALAPLFRAGGFGGMLLFSVVGVWGAAIAAGLIARRLRPTFGVPALWLTGIGSPLFFDAYLVSAHAVATAAAGFLALGVCIAVDSHRMRALLLAVPGCAVLVMLRSEGILLAAAIGGIVGLEGLVPMLKRKAPNWATITVGAVVLGTATVAYLVDAAWSRAVVDGVTTAPSGLGRSLIADRDPLSAAWASLFRPWYPNALNAQTALVISAAAIVLAAAAIRLMPTRWLLPLALLTVSAVAAVLQQFSGFTLVTGLFAAFPVLLAGLILLRRADVVSVPTARLLAVSALTSVGLLLTIYSQGGAAEWGGRFFHMLLPLIIPVTVLGLYRGWLALPHPQRVVAGALLSVAVVAAPAIGIRYLHVLRVTHQDLVESTLKVAEASHGRDTSSSPTSKPLVVVGLLDADGLSRIYWQSRDRADVVVAIGAGNLFQVVSAAEKAGYTSVTVVSNLSAGEMITVSKKWLDELDWVILKGEQAGSTPFGVYQLGPRPAS